MGISYRDNELNGEIRDTDNALMVRTKMAPLGWTYHGHAIQLETSKLNSLKEKKALDNTNWNWCSIKFYDDEDNELTTQEDLDLYCVKTIIDWEAPVDFELIGGDVRATESPSTDVTIDVIAAPDIPEIYGGTKYMITGVNFRFIQAKTPIHTDGRVSKRIQYNSEDHRGKIRFIFLHNIGIKLEIMILLEGYKE